MHVDCKAEQAPAVSIEVAVPLGLLVNELLSNASRHAFPGEGVQLVIQVTDNGRGFDPEQVERGLGLVLVEELATQINAETSYERPAGGGSRWEISLPV